MNRVKSGIDAPFATVSDDLDKTSPCTLRVSDNFVFNAPIHCDVCGNPQCIPFRMASSGSSSRLRGAIESHSRAAGVPAIALPASNSTKVRSNRTRLAIGRPNDRIGFVNATLTMQRRNRTPTMQAAKEPATVSTPPSNATQVVSKFLYQHHFEQSEAAIIVLRLQPTVTLIAANDRARGTFGLPKDWSADRPDNYQNASIAEQILATTGIVDDARARSHHHRCKLGLVQWTPFAEDDASYAVLTILSASEPSVTKATADNEITDLQPDTVPNPESMNAMAVAHWLKTFIHQVSQPLHVNQNTADILQIEAEQNKIDSQSIQPRLERMQFAGNLLRECLSDLRKQIQLMSFEFSHVDIQETLQCVATDFQRKHAAPLQLQLSSLGPKRFIHGNATLLKEALSSSLDLLWGKRREEPIHPDRDDAPDSCLSLSAFDEDGHIQIQITVNSESENSIKFVDYPLMKQTHMKLMPAATWGVCESIIQAHYGELRHEENEESEQIQIRLPESCDRTQQPNINVALHRAWSQPGDAT